MVILVGIHPRQQGTRLANVRAVHLRLELQRGCVGRIQTVRLDVVVGLERQVLDRVSKGQLHHGGVRHKLTLDLGDQHILGRLGEVVTLGLIQVDEVGPENVLQILVLGGRQGRRTAEGGRVQVRRPRDPQLDVVVLQSHQGQGRLPILAEEELERLERVVVETSLRRRVRAVVLGQQTLVRVRRTDHRLDVVHPVCVLSINHLAANQQINLIDDARPVQQRHLRTS